MLDALMSVLERMHDAIRKTPTFQWGVVTGVSPLTIRLDGDDADLISPATTVASLTLADRVLVLNQNSKITIIGRGGG